MHQTPPGFFRHIGGQNVAAAEFNKASGTERQVVAFQQPWSPPQPQAGVQMRQVPAPIIVGAPLLQFPTGPQLSGQFMTTTADPFWGYNAAAAPIMVGTPARRVPSIPIVRPKVTHAVAMPKVTQPIPQV